MSAAVAEAAIHRFTFILGSVHDKIGGPTRTIWGYVQGLQMLGKSAHIVGIGSSNSMQSNFAEAGAASISGIDGSLIFKINALQRLYKSQTQSSALVIVGVWHLPFFVLGFLKILSTIVPALASPRIILIPTMSLTDYDWAKHKLVKLCLRPIVGLILRKIEGVVFASTGECELSGPRTWRRAEVILHPSVTITSDTSNLEADRDIDVLFVGRIDPQKDLPLLLESFSGLQKHTVLHLVGDGDTEYVRGLQQEAERFSLAHRIVWHGWKSHAETQKFFRRARVVVVTSVVENYCHAAVEALVAAADLVLVNRVMSAQDFAQLADIDVVPAYPLDVAQSLRSRLGSWERRSESRQASASAVRLACSPTGAANAISAFVANIRS